jgi:uncharacterized flavoprotein (TIGR03862 family)
LKRPEQKIPKKITPDLPHSPLTEGSKRCYDIVVVGAGPAGLMAADQAAQTGLRVAIVEKMPSPARKFLMAGKTGLNLTKKESPETFLNHFDKQEELKPILEEFGPTEVINFARELKQEVFTGSTGRVFPISMKASPLLRSWMKRLDSMGVTLLRQHEWIGPVSNSDFNHFEAFGKQISIPAKALILSVGGASWARLGSNGAWAERLKETTIQLAPFKPSNVGVKVEWSDYMKPYFGRPLKNISISVAGLKSRGELVVTSTGIEGGAIYELGKTLLESSSTQIDLAPQINISELQSLFENRNSKDSISNFLRKYVKLDSTKRALVYEFNQLKNRNPYHLAKAIKEVTVPLLGPQPIDQAISTGGGVVWDSLTPDLMLKAYPGIFCAGEMIDWDAPTGGYLINACMATGRWAGRASANYVLANARL